MSNDVFANGREISCKSGSGKSICAFPDVCFTPPENAATPPGVPIPYPNTGMASDTTSGSKTVKITKKEVMLKNKSYFKKSTGDEAGSAAKKGVVTSVNRGKVYFNAWSMDVKIEGENVVRHLDLTTHNHASSTTNTPPMIHVDSMAYEFPVSCKKHVDDNNEACQGATQIKNKKGAKQGMNCDNAKDPKKCKAARRCLLMSKAKDKSFCCHPSTTGHHMIESHCFCEKGDRGTALPEFQGYDVEAAPCVCAEGPRHHGEHGDFHAIQGVRERGKILIVKQMIAEGQPTRRTPERAWSYGEAKQAGLDAHEDVFGPGACDPGCLEDQLDKFHSKFLSEGDDTLVRSYNSSLSSKHNQKNRGVNLEISRIKARINSMAGGS
ncbi:MAG TPA: DUF4150 domain-containing protein [Sedimenticola sp.]|nr:DUF4150 domain-containing protein [Sedimenticola sp.]